MRRSGHDAFTWNSPDLGLDLRRVVGDGGEVRLGGARRNRSAKVRALLSRPGLTAVVDVLRSVPAVDVPFSSGPAGEALHECSALRRGLVLSRVPVALLPLPATQAEYLRGRPRQALRTNINRATAMGITCSVVDPGAELDEAVAHIAARRHQAVDAMLAREVAPGITRRFTVARNAQGEPVALSVTVLDGAVAGLSTLVTVPTEGDGQLLRYLLHAETVRDLIGQGVDTVVVSGSMLLSTAGTRYFQRRTGYEPVWLRPVTAPSAVAVVPAAVVPAAAA